MLYTIFNAYGYTMKSDDWKKNLNNIDGYNWLFNFLGADLSKLSSDFSRQKESLLNCLKEINKDTFYESALNIQGKKLMDLHPFYEMIISQENHPFYGFSEGTKYLTEQVLFYLFYELSIQHPESQILNELYNYKEIISFFRHENVNSLFTLWYTSIIKRSNGSTYNQFFMDLIELQHKLRSWSFLLLDLDAKPLNQLNKKQRINMYGFFSNSILNLQEVVEKTLYSKKPPVNNSIPDITVTENLYFSNADNNISMIEHNGKRLWASDQNMDHLKIFLSLQTAYLDQHNTSLSHILEYFVQVFKSDFATNNYWVKEIVSPNLTVLLSYEFSRLLDSDLMIRKCKTCGKYFIPSNHKSFYCTRKNEETMKRCCEESPKIRHVNKLKKLGIYQEYNQINNKIRYCLKQYNSHKNRDEILKKQNELSKIKEKLIDYIDVEKAKECDEYKEFFIIAKDIKSILKNKNI